jgi:hypothetical protein
MRSVSLCWLPERMFYTHVHLCDVRILFLLGSRFFPFRWKVKKTIVSRVINSKCSLLLFYKSELYEVLYFDCRVSGWLPHLFDYFALSLCAAFRPHKITKSTVILLRVEILNSVVIMALDFQCFYWFCATALLAVHCRHAFLLPVFVLLNSKSQKQLPLLRIVPIFCLALLTFCFVFLIIF